MSRQLDTAVDAAFASFQAGDLGGAAAACAEVLRKAPRNARALRLLGAVRLQGGDAQSASVLLDKAARLSPADDRVHEDLAVAQLALGEYGAAERTLRRALKLAARPRASLHARLAYALNGLERHDESEDALRAALGLEPHMVALMMDLANALARRGAWSEARTWFEQAAAAEPERPEAVFNLAVVLEREGRHEDAAQAYAEVITRFPTYHDAYINLGIVHEYLGRTDEALRCYETALRIDPASAHAYANLGKALRAAGRLDEAQAACLQALRIAPAFSDAMVNLAGVLTDQGRAEEALAEYERALEIDPEAADAQFSYAALNLALGRYEQGWRSYAWRPTRLRARATQIELDDRLPAKLERSHILVLGEQGLGDELFFLRYAAALQARGAHVHVECDPRLATLLDRSGAFESVTMPGQSRPLADHAYVAGDLPLLFMEAGHSDIPPPLALSALESRVTSVRETLHRLGPPPYMGLTWAAGTPLEHQRGRPDRALFKSVPLETLALALRSTQGTFVALQRQPRAGDIERLSSLLGADVHDFSDANGDLEQMLALLWVLDDYVGVSNTNMHLRAGLGRAAQVLVPNPPEWRWTWTGTASPWFPQFRVYRETADAGWGVAMAELAHLCSAVGGRE